MSTPNKSAGGRGAVIFSVAIAGLGIFLAVRWGATPSPPDYGPTFDRKRAEVSPSVAQVERVGDRPDTPGAEQRSLANQGTVAGRVLDTQDRAVAGCVVSLLDTSGRKVEATQATDPEGYFSIKLERGAYRARATAPGFCMFPTRLVDAETGKDPVRIYMHQALQFTIEIVDVQSRSALMMPFETKVAVSVGGVELPLNDNVRLNPEVVWAEGEAPSMDGPLRRRVVRVLGRDTESKLLDAGSIEVRAAFPGVRIEPVVIRGEWARSADSVVTLVATPLEGWVPIKLEPRYRGGAAMLRQFICNLRSSDEQKIDFWGVTPGQVGFFVVRPGKWRAEVGYNVRTLQDVDIEVSGNAYSVVSIPVERRGDLLVQMRRDSDGVDLGCAGVEVTGRVVGVGKPVELVLGPTPAEGECRWLDLAAGSYSVRARDLKGHWHRQDVTVENGREVTVTFRVSTDGK